MSRVAERPTVLSLKDDLDKAIDESIRTCGGDARVAVGTLILTRPQSFILRQPKTDWCCRA